MANTTQTLDILTIADLGSASISKLGSADSMVELIRDNGKTGDELVRLYAIRANNEGPEPTHYAITTNGEPDIYSDRSRLIEALASASARFIDMHEAHRLEDLFDLCFGGI